MARRHVKEFVELRRCASNLQQPSAGLNRCPPRRASHLSASGRTHELHHRQCHCKERCSPEEAQSLCFSLDDQADTLILVAV